MKKSLREEVSKSVFVVPESHEISIEEALPHLDPANVQRELEQESREIKRQLILQETEKKLRELNGERLSTFEMPPIPKETSPTDSAVQECKKLISTFKSYLEESQKELDKEKNSTQVIQTVNKNAYEIRFHVLELAVSIAQCTKHPNSMREPLNVADDVLKMAREFYQFVENKR